LRHNVEGDRQADLTVHGGPDKAVYGYASEHYPIWRREFPEIEMPWGMFGENLTTEGLTENSVHIGDTLRAGTAVLRVTQPRMPCFKLGIKFGRDDVIRKFRQKGLSGFYFAVEQEGDVAGGDRIEFLTRDARGVSIAEFNHIYADKSPAAEALQHVLSLPSLSSGMRRHFAGMLARATQLN